MFYEYMTREDADEEIQKIKDGFGDSGAAAASAAAPAGASADPSSSVQAMSVPASSLVLMPGHDEADRLTSCVVCSSMSSRGLR